MKLSTERARRIRQEGSPYFSYTPALILAGADSYIWLATQFPASAKYAPLDWYEIVNNSGENLIITINAGQQYVVPAGTTRKDDLLPIHSYNIHNSSATDTVAGEIVVMFARQPITEDKALRQR